MAKAIATCTCSECGTSFEKIAYKRNRKEADTWEAWAAEHYTTCPACEEKAYQARIAKVAEDAKADGLTELTGSQKQINWALDIRKTLMDEINEKLELSRGRIKDTKTEQLYKELELTAEYILSQASASWWIDHRDTNGRSMLNDFHDEAMAQHTEDLVEASELDTLDEDDMIIPENATEGTVEIKVDGTMVTASYPKDYKFRAIIKTADYKWNPDGGCWQKVITEQTGNAEDRAADIANRLMRDGFSIRCKNAAVRKKAINGDFEHECKNWISLVIVGGDKDAWLGISLPGKDDDDQGLYDKARMIKGSRYHKEPGEKGCVIVPMAHYAEVLDFADLYGYKIYGRARKEIDRYAAKATVKAAEPNRHAADDKLNKILQSDDAVLEDLKDEDR